jgi:opacity protein-like surface antigen
MALPVFSFAASGLYVSLNTGVAWLTDSNWTNLTGPETLNIEYDAGYTFGGALGFMVENFRYEAEIAYQKSDFRDFTEELSALTFLGNGYFDFPTASPVIPFITAGIGVSRIENSASGFPTVDDTVLAYQVGAGVGYAVSRALTLDFRYRYLSGEDVQFQYGNGETWEMEFGSHNLTAGLRMAF